MIAKVIVDHSEPSSVMHRDLDFGEWATFGCSGYITPEALLKACLSPLPYFRKAPSHSNVAVDGKHRALLNGPENGFQVHLDKCNISCSSRLFLAGPDLEVIELPRG